MLRDELAKNLRMALLRIGKDALWLAKASHLHIATVRRILRGEGAKLDYIDACARALGIDPAVLLGLSPAEPAVRPDTLELAKVLTLVPPNLTTVLTRSIERALRQA